MVTVRAHASGLYAGEIWQVVEESPGYRTEAVPIYQTAYPEPVDTLAAVPASYLKCVGAVFAPTPLEAKAKALKRQRDKQIKDKRGSGV